MHTYRNILLAALPLCMLAVAPAAAQTPRIYGPDVLQPDALQACMSEKRILDATRAELDRRLGEIKQAAAALEAFAAELEQQRRTLDGTPPAVELYNTRNREMGRRRDAHAADVVEYNADAATYNAQIESYQDRCGNKFFFQEDADRAR